jgi:hypothetical protein
MFMLMYDRWLERRLALEEGVEHGWLLFFLD